jgi:hypothetical protein
MDAVLLARQTAKPDIDPKRFAGGTVGLALAPPEFRPGQRGLPRGQDRRWEDPPGGQKGGPALSMATRAYVLESSRISLEGKGWDLLNNEQVGRA